MGDYRALCTTIVLFSVHFVLQGLILCCKSPVSRDSGFAAHQLCFLFCMSYCAIFGCWLWANRADEITDHVYGYHQGASLLAEFNCSFQIYDLVISLYEKTLRKTDRIVHHSVAMVLAFWSYHDNLLQYYSIFFFGVSEVSSVFLTFVEFFKEFPRLRNPAINPYLTQVNEISRIMFAALFISIRVVYWPYISMQFWGDSLDALSRGRGYSFELIFTMIANIGLTLLQFHWGSMIARQIHRKLFSSSAAPDGGGESISIDIDGNGANDDIGSPGKAVEDYKYGTMSSDEPRSSTLGGSLLKSAA